MAAKRRERDAKQTAARRHLTWGLIPSVCWLGAITVFAWVNWAEARPTKLNEWGDFLAGAVAPVAFWWLVLAYMQQRDELRQNTDALLLQQQELRKQVEETQELVSQTQRHADATEILARATITEPSLTFVSAKDYRNAEHRFVGTEVTLVNDGALARQVSIKLPSAEHSTLLQNRVAPNGRFMFLVGQHDYGKDFHLSYLDGRGRTHVLLCCLSGRDLRMDEVFDSP